MQTAKEAREARRKRILERGSDRLAYITGDASKHQSVKVSPISPPQGASSIAAPHEESVGDPRESVSVSQPSFTAQSSAECLDTTPVFTSSSRSLAEPTYTAPVFASTSSDSSLTRPVGVKVGKKSRTTLVKNIVHSIEASEGLRALAAAVVAVFIVLQTILSCCGHPWGNALVIFLPRWPISLVFLTDCTVVIGTYILHSHHKSSQKRLGVTESEGPDGSLDVFSKALDVMGNFEDLFNIGLLCKKAAGALSLDCSVYVVTLVCGFSVSQYAFSCCTDF
eukprot:c11150_g1_i1 orf=345-1184(+)